MFVLYRYWDPLEVLMWHGVYPASTFGDDRSYHQSQAWYGQLWDGPSLPKGRYNVGPGIWTMSFGLTRKIDIKADDRGPSVHLIYFGFES